MFRALILCLLVAAMGLLHPGPATAAEFQLNGHTFTLPDGFEIEQIAGPPLVERPIVIDFDDAGRLYVADSSGSNDPVAKQLEEEPHRILRLEDTNGDGRFDRRTVFADKMMFPEGTLWYDGSLYVAAPPSIWKLTDTDGDGVADRREEWFKGQTLTGCANDLHGPYLGPDGWIYWCKGAFAKQTYERPGKEPFVTRAAHIFRARPDGTGIEPVMTGGMDNPVDVVFTPAGERIFTTTFLQNPGGGRRDGLIHAIYGGVYGKVQDVIEEHKRTGDVLPVLSHLGPAAPCGLTSYESRVFGPEYQDNLFACLFNLHKVTRHVLEPAGATFQSHDSDFLVSDNFDFHPTDVQEDADGSLIVVDTGGWYKLCCPTSQLWKPDVLGAIYRVRKTGAPRVEDPRGRKIDWPALGALEFAELLGDRRPVVRRRAVHELAKRGATDEDMVSTLQRVVKVGLGLEKATDVTPEIRRNAVWALTGIESKMARAGAQLALLDADATVRQAALHSVSLRPDREILPPVVIKLLTDPSLPNRRVAAEALGRIGESRAVDGLMMAAAASETRPDRALEHSLIYALIEIADPGKTESGLKHANPEVRRVALIALDQMDGGGLDPNYVAGLLAADDPLIKETAGWIIGRHSDWGDALAGFLKSRIGRGDLSEAERAELEGQLAQFARAASIQTLLISSAEDTTLSIAARRVTLSAMARSGLKEAPGEWLAGLARVLTGADKALIESAVAAARALPAPKSPPAEFAAALLAVARDGAQPAAVRLSALAAVPGGLPAVEPALYTLLREALAPENEVPARTSAADVLARSTLDAGQLEALCEAFAAAGPLEADRLLPAFKECADERIGLKLIAALLESPVVTGLRIDTLKASLGKFPAPVQEQFGVLVATINVDAEKQKEKIDSLLASLKDGDVRRGQAVFNSQKAACAVCHQFGYVGGNVGPDLTRIGQIRTERDLLESIVFPSASFVRSYEPVVVLTTSGKSFSGVIRSDRADEIVLATGPREEARIARSEIEEMRSGNVSVMPAGLDQQLSIQDIADLVAFLKGAK